MGVLLGLTAALCWGVVGLVGRGASRSLGAARAALFSQAVGLVALSAYLLATGTLGRGPSGWAPWAWGALAAALNALGVLALYRALEVGVLALAAPMAASYGALTALFAIAGGEALGPTRAVGIVAVVLGVILAAAPSSAATPGGLATGRRLPRGVGWALAASISFGVAFWLLGSRVTPALGGLAPIWLFRLVGVPLLGLAAATTPRGLRPPAGREWGLLVGLEVLNLGGLLATAAGLGTGEVAVVTVLGSLSSAVTVLLGWAVLRERLGRHQWLGVAITLAGVALVSA